MHKTNHPSTMPSSLPFIPEASLVDTIHGARKKYSDNLSIPLLSESHNMITDQNDYLDLNNSQILFMNRQKTEIDISYKQWTKYFIILSVIFIIYGLVIIGLWMPWIVDINSEDLVCVQLKGNIIWVCIVYIFGIVNQILGIAAAKTKKNRVFYIYGTFLLAIFIARVIIDANALNTAVQILSGCVNKTVKELAPYIYETAVYCAMILILIVYTVKLLHCLKRIEKANRVYQEYISKNHV